MDIIENGLARAREGLGQTLHHIGVLDGHRRETSSRFRGCGKVAAHIAIGRCVGKPAPVRYAFALRSEEHTSELQSLMRISYAVFCLKKKNKQKQHHKTLH